MKSNSALTLAFTLLTALAILPSCSLDYEKEESPESSYPEFTFNNAEFTKVEKSKKKVKMNADKIEKYKADSLSFAKNVDFSTFDEDGNDDTQGSCDLISADTAKEHYILFGDVKMNMISQNMQIFADSLNFDKKNEQITSGLDQKVTIKREDIDMSGIGFSASGVSKTFAFDRDVSGFIETDEETNEKDKDGKEEKSDKQN
ncbi:MAG: LPS export ABC transporter periplasmic protein LptC [Treponema sp.]|nr:LPS export ABC transporter periplasmic protein LptC [Treponema sp.]